MLFQSLLYCSNSCASLHFKTLKSHTKTLNIRPYMFRSSLKPSSGGQWPYFVRLLNWNVDLHLLQRVSVCGCMSIYFVCVCVCVCVSTYLVEIMSWNSRHNLDQIGTHTNTHTHKHTQTEWIYIQPHTDTLYNKCKSTFQLSNLAKYGHWPPEDGFKGDRNI